MSSASLARVVEPVPVEDEDIAGVKPYRLTGLIDAVYGWGSGVVVAHPRVVLSCAHVIYDIDYRRWLSGARWFRAWNGDEAPEPGQGDVLNGYFYWRSYAAAFRAAERARLRPFGGLRAIAREFNLDAVAYFSYVDDLGAGDYAEVFADGAPWLASGFDKWVTGYPSGRYDEGDPLEFRLHSTGSFANALRREVRSAKQYMTLDDWVETGPGNSGGPVWMEDPEDNENYIVAGVLVSGAERADTGFSSIGVHAVSSRSWRLILSAVETAGMGSAAQSWTASFVDATTAIPDATTRPRNGRLRTRPGEVARSIVAAGLPATLNELQLDLVIEHDDKSDVVVLIQPPGQRRWAVYDGLYDEEPGAEVRFDREEVPMFYGINPNGRWTLRVLDMASGGDTGQIISAKIHVVSRR